MSHQFFVTACFDLLLTGWIWCYVIMMQTHTRTQTYRMYLRMYFMWYTVKPLFQLTSNKYVLDVKPLQWFQIVLGRKHKCAQSLKVAQKDYSMKEILSEWRCSPTQHGKPSLCNPGSNLCMWSGDTGSPLRPATVPETPDVSTSSMCVNNSCVDVFIWVRETQGSIQALCPRWHLHCVLKSQWALLNVVMSISKLKCFFFFSLNSRSVTKFDSIWSSKAFIHSCIDWLIILFILS